MFPFPLYLITDPLLCEQPFQKRGEKDAEQKSLFDVIEEAMTAGARLAQYREKNAPRSHMYETAKRLREITARHGATLIINDDVDLALAVEADGVHLGQEDLPLWVARKILGERAIVGISTHRVEEAVRAEVDGADYIGFGPIFETQTKESAHPAVGIDAIGAVKQQVRIPLYAIGGIRLSNLSEIMTAGADGVAVVSGLAGEIRSNVEKWMAKLDKKG